MEERKIVESISEKILDFMYPQVCGICGKLNKNSLCKKCEIKLQKHAIFEVEDYTQITSYFNEHIYLFLYDGFIRDILMDYKFNEKSYLYKTFISFLKKNEKVFVQIKKYDIIIPVPISKKRFNQRGYNQSDLFARDIANFLKIEYLKNGLIKSKDNLPQSTLNLEERQKNVKDVYEINKRKKLILKDKRILVIDDIFTTGNTVNECSKVLIENDVKEVGILTIAKK